MSFENLCQIFTAPNFAVPNFAPPPPVERVVVDVGHFQVSAQAPEGAAGPSLVCDTPQPPPPPPRVLKDSGAGAMAPMAPNFLSMLRRRGYYAFGP